MERAEALSSWLATRLGVGHVEVDGLVRSGAGNSNETVSFEARWDGHTERLVVRLQPGGDSLFLRPSVVREAAVIESVGRAKAVPVPKVFGVEPDAGPLGTPFFLMEHVDGRVLNDMPSYHRRGWLVDLSPAERARHWDEGLKAMVGVAAVEASDVPALERDSGPPLQALLEATRELFDWAAQGRAVGLLDTTMEHLEATLPPRHDGALSWGDARPGNLLYAPDGSVAAVLDWEMAAIAPAEVDLGWWLLMEEIYSTRGGYPRLEGVPGEEEIVPRWEELMGRPARDLRWCQLLAGLRMGLVMLRSRDQQVGRGLIGPEATTHLFNPVTQQLAIWLGLPVPDPSPDFAVLMRALRDEKEKRSS
jgi:aminoglycoside phosphotransferase (APT) family kinase protein